MVQNARPAQGYVIAGAELSRNAQVHNAERIPQQKWQDHW